MLVYWLDIVGTAVFAISGVLLAGKLRMDPFGVLVLGVVTAVGGGTIRDMALDNGPVFWVKDPTDLVVAMRNEADLGGVPFILISSETRPHALDPVSARGS